MRKLPYSILKRLNRLLRPEHSIVRRKGLRLLLDKNNWIDNRLLCFRSYEKKNVDFILKTLHADGFDRFLDIGANIGYMSLMAARHTLVPEIMAFEPMSRNFYQLCSNIFLNEFQGRIKPYNYALDQKDGTAEIHFSETSTGIATLAVSDSVRKRSDYTNSETIECRVFDRLFDIKNEKLFIKMDVEQFEMNVLSGMVETLKNNKILLLIEINDPDSPVFGLLREHGFKTRAADIDDYLFSNF